LQKYKKLKQDKTSITQHKPSFIGLAKTLKYPLLKRQRIYFVRDTKQVIPKAKILIMNY